MHLSTHARPCAVAEAMGAVLAAGLAGATVVPRGRPAGLGRGIVGNPQMEDIADLTPDLFTAETGIKVDYTVLEEGKLREVTTRDVGAGGEQFDVVMIGMYEAPQFGVNGWLRRPHARTPRPTPTTRSTT